MLNCRGEIDYTHQNTYGSFDSIRGKLSTNFEIKQIIYNKYKFSNMNSR